MNPSSAAVPKVLRSERMIKARGIDVGVKMGKKRTLADKHIICGLKSLDSREMKHFALIGSLDEL